MGFFDKIKQGLKRTTDAVSEQFSDIMSTFVKIDADSLEQLEEALILSDIGATVAAEATEKVEDIAKHQRIDTPLALRCVLKDVLSDMMDHDTELHLDTKPAVILVIGVNLDDVAHNVIELLAHGIGRALESLFDFIKKSHVFAPYLANL